MFSARPPACRSHPPAQVYARLEVTLPVINRERKRDIVAQLLSQAAGTGAAPERAALQSLELGPGTLVRWHGCRAVRPAWPCAPAATPALHLQTGCSGRPHHERASGCPQPALPLRPPTFSPQGVQVCNTAGAAPARFTVLLDRAAAELLGQSVEAVPAGGLVPAGEVADVSLLLGVAGTAPLRHCTGEPRVRCCRLLLLLASQPGLFCAAGLAWLLRGVRPLHPELAAAEASPPCTSAGSPRKIPSPRACPPPLQLVVEPEGGWDPRDAATQCWIAGKVRRGAVDALAGKGRRPGLAWPAAAGGQRVSCVCVQGSRPAGRSQGACQQGVAALEVSGTASPPPLLQVVLQPELCCGSEHAARLSVERRFRVVWRKAPSMASMLGAMELPPLG